MIKITKIKIEKIVKTYLSKEVEYYGVCVNDNTFTFFDKTNKEWLFLPKKFFIDLIKEEEKNETIKNKKNIQLQRKGYSNPDQKKLL